MHNSKFKIFNKLQSIKKTSNFQNHEITLQTFKNSKKQKFKNSKIQKLQKLQIERIQNSTLHNQLIGKYIYIYLIFSRQTL